MTIRMTEWWKPFSGVQSIWWVPWTTICWPCTRSTNQSQGQRNMSHSFSIAKNIIEWMEPMWLCQEKLHILFQDTLCVGYSKQHFSWNTLNGSILSETYASCQKLALRHHHGWQRSQGRPDHGPYPDPIHQDTIVQADALVAEAEKKLSGGKGFLSGLFGCQFLLIIH